MEREAYARGLRWQNVARGPPWREGPPADTSLGRYYRILSRTRLASLRARWQGPMPAAVLWNAASMVILLATEI